MGKILKLIKEYKNALYVLLACIAITLTGFAFNKGEYYQYNYERQSLKDCEMGWYEANHKMCENYKERQRVLDEEEINNDGKITIPPKSNFDYVMFLASILQVVFISIATFNLGVSTKGQIDSIKKDKERMAKICKHIMVWLSMFIVIVALTGLANLLFVMVNGVFSSNDFLRFLFEIVISVITFILGKKL